MGKGEKPSHCCSGGCFGWFILGIVVIAIIISLGLLFTYNDDDDKATADPTVLTKKYGNALKVAMQFFDIQKSGKLVNNKIPWRGNSGLKDGSEEKLDLSKGMYDAGDHMKFGFPMAFTATVLSWAILEYGNHMSSIHQLQPAQESLKWITDYLINAHPEPDVLYVQVGDGVEDHKCWNRPEDMSIDRPLAQVNADAPGSDVAGETAAAMAAASLVFRTTDPTYSTTLLKHAKDLFAFADKYRGLYTESVVGVEHFYNSTGYGDELLWAAGWLYHATGDKTYIDFVTGDNGDSYANWGDPTYFTWDNKLAGAQVLLSRVSFFGSDNIPNADVLQKYKRTAEAVMCNLLPESPTATNTRSDGGILWVSEWNSLHHPVASAFLATVYSDYMLTSETKKLSCKGTSFTPAELRDFAMSQADYVLGDNPIKMSYLVGYGKKYPEFVHHRGASIPKGEKPTCKEGFKWLDSPDPNPNIAYGAVVGGPFLNDTFVDSRNNTMQTEPSVYNTATLVGLLSGLLTTSPVVKSFIHT